jgi:hypothetical protein
MTAKALKKALFIGALISAVLSFLAQKGEILEAESRQTSARSLLRLKQEQMAKAYQNTKQELELAQWRAEGQRRFLAERQFSALAELELARARGLFQKPTPVRLLLKNCLEDSSTGYRPSSPLVLPKAKLLLDRMQEASLAGVSEWRCELAGSPTAVTVLSRAGEAPKTVEPLACSLLHTGVSGTPWICVTPRGWIPLLTGGLATVSIPFANQWEIIEICSLGVPVHPAFGDFRFPGCESPPSS